MFYSWSVFTFCISLNFGTWKCSMHFYTRNSQAVLSHKALVPLCTWHSPWKTQPVFSFIFPGINREIKGHEVQLRWVVLRQQPSCCHSSTQGGNSLMFSTCCEPGVTGMRWWYSGLDDSVGTVLPYCTVL